MPALKRNVTAVLVFLLLLLISGQALASGDGMKEIASGIVAPLWVNADAVNAGLTFSGSQASCSGRVIGKAGTTKITATVVLARQNQNGSYTTVRTWSGLVSYGDTLIFSGTHYVTTGYTYRLKLTATVNRNGISETVTAYSSAYAGQPK